MKALPILCALIVFSTMVCAQDIRVHAIDKALAVCEKKQGAFTRGEAECLTVALESWERDVTDTYDALKKQVSDTELKSLAAGHKNWSEYRDREFEFINELFLNKRGTMYVPRRISYRIELVKARAVELETYLRAVRRLKGLEN